MIVILGLIILIAAVIAGVAGVLTNGGHAHALTQFSALGYHVTGSTGTVFLYGIVTGALAILGLSMLLAGARRTSRRGRTARLGLAQSRRETAAVSQDRDDLIGQRDTARADTASALANGAPADDHDDDDDDDDPSADNAPRTTGLRAFAGRSTARHGVAQPETADSQPTADAPVSASAVAE
jgi:hypothetical protein